MIRICKVCAKEFKAKPSRVKKGWGNFCSRPCSTKAIKTGIKFTEEHKKKIGLANRGKPNFFKGKTRPKETREKMSKNSSHWNKGVKQSKESVEKRKKTLARGERNPKWRGDDVSYSGLHYWVARYLGRPKICEHCSKVVENTKFIHWANKDHSYKRNLTDWIRLCVQCHRKYDESIKTR